LEVEKRKAEKSGSRKPGQAKTANKKNEKRDTYFVGFVKFAFAGGACFFE
jgi:hypothetical protein